MKEVKIFLASSVVEFHNLRLQLVEFISDLENIVDDGGIDLDLFVCEAVDDNMVKQGKQEQYNSYIRKPCDIFFNLYGKRAGEYTIEELELAKQTYLTHNVPKIYVNFDEKSFTAEDKDLVTLHEMAKESDFIVDFDFKDITILKLQLLFAIKQVTPEIELILVDNELKIKNYASGNDNDYLRLMRLSCDEHCDFVTGKLL